MGNMKNCTLHYYEVCCTPLGFRDSRSNTSSMRGAELLQFVDMLPPPRPWFKELFKELQCKNAASRATEVSSYA